MYWPQPQFQDLDPYLRLLGVEQVREVLMDRTQSHLSLETQVNRTAVRDALNNHYANRLRMQIMMALALDPADADVALAQAQAALAQTVREVRTLYVSNTTWTANIAQREAEVERAKAALKMAETNLRYTTIRSPVNGIVISRNVDVGQTVAASLQAPTLFTIAKDLTQMQVDTNYSEADIGRIEKEQEATFTVDAYPERTFRGRVSQIRNAPQTIQNVVTYDVVIQVDNKELRLKPGMTANVTIVVAHREGVLKIPNAALRYQPQGARTMVAAVSKKGEDSSSPGTPSSSAKSGGNRPGGGRDPSASVSRFTEGLNLSPDQQQKAEMIISASRQEIQEIRQKSKPEEARVKIQNLIREKLKGMLTEDQKRKLDESANSTQTEKKSGRIWLVSTDGKAAPVSVVLGITDGAFSEILSGDLSEGTDVIVGEATLNNQPNRATPSPFGGGPGGMRK